MATLATSERFFAPGITKVYYLPTVAATNLTPTRAEITAGTDLSGELADVGGFVYTGSTISAPDMGTTFDSKVSGRNSVADSSLTFYTDKPGDDVRAVLPKGTTGYIYFADGGDVTSYLIDVFPVTVLATGVNRTVGDSVSTITVQFSVTAAPGISLTNPATA